VDEPIEDVLYLWAFHHCPALLLDQQLFNGLVLFIHRLLLRAVKAEKDAADRRTARPSPN
jgi:hypothetical protein